MGTSNPASSTVTSKEVSSLQICGVTITGVVTVGVWAVWVAGETVGAGKCCHRHNGRLDTPIW